MEDPVHHDLNNDFDTDMPQEAEVPDSPLGDMNQDLTKAETEEVPDSPLLDMAQDSNEAESEDVPDSPLIDVNQDAELELSDNNYDYGDHEEEGSEEEPLSPVDANDVDVNINDHESDEESVDDAGSIVSEEDVPQTKEDHLHEESVDVADSNVSEEDVPKTKEDHLHEQDEPEAQVVDSTPSEDKQTIDEPEAVITSPVDTIPTKEEPAKNEQIVQPVENAPAKGFDNSIKIKELEDRISELEETLKSKDTTIVNLQSEVERLNTEIKSRSVPTPKKPSSAGADARSKTVGAKKTRPVSGHGAKAVSKPVSNGVPKKGGLSPGKTTRTAATRPKTAPAKPTGTKSAGKKSGKGGTRVEMAKGVDGEEHAVKLMLRGRGIVCYPPTDFSMEGIQSDKPDEKLKINWVYGYRGRDSQDNIFALPSNELLYFQAAVGVIYNPSTKTQRFYPGHNDDIKCIALNPTNPNIVATGQAAGHDEKEGDPHVKVWNCETLETLATLGLGVLQRAVGNVAFSPDGSKVLAVDEGNDHTIYIYDWKKKSTSVASQKGHQDPVLGAEYIPGSNNRFVTYGKGHIIFWEQDGNKLLKKSGLFEKHPKPRFITSLAFNGNGDPITGDSNGNLFLWNPNERKIAKSKVGAHEGSVYSIAVKGNEILTGGQDCKVKKVNGDDLAEIDSWQLDASVHGRVKALAFVGEDIAVGTYNNGMLFGKFGDEPEQIIYGHGAGDLWGGANNPVDNTFATVGQDKIVYIWDADTHAPKHIFKVEKPAQSCGFSPCGSVLAVASTTGEWWVLDSSTGDLLSSYKSGPEQIDAISYSPDGKCIAVGSHDNFVYLFECDDIRSEYKQIGRCAGHSSFITHLDFSDDGKVLQTTSGDYEHLFWDTKDGDQITSTKDLRDVVMSTYTCTLGFPVCGIWPVGYDGTDINALCRSNDNKLVVTADDFGLVNLFRYPCCNPTAEWSSFRGHSAHVTKVRFLTGDKEIFSLGGRDQSIIQWGIC